MFGKLLSTTIVAKNGLSYEEKTFENTDGSVSTVQRLVTKASYTTPIANAQAQLDLLNSLQAACLS